MFLQGVDTETRQQIDNLLVLYYKRGGGLPVDIELLIKSLSRLTDNYIEIIEDFWSTRKKGYTSPVRWGFRIYVGYSDSLFQKRFTIGHEIGHILHTYDYTEEMPTQRPWRRSPMIFPNREEECICDEIAGYILCPQELVIKFLEDFQNIPCQLELFRKRQGPPFHAKLKLLSEIFGIPLPKFCWYIKRQFGKEKLLSLINSA